jgi:murein DD-endopeptidase MepM/ murein hydrolase activator NlpD
LNLTNNRFDPPKRKTSRWVVILLLVIIAAGAGILLYRGASINKQRLSYFLTWIRNPSSKPEWTITMGQRCGDGPFILPTDGFIGFLWDDSFRIGHRHQGIDIFAGEPVNTTPVISAYPGYLTRLPDWKSTVIIRIPEDPLNPSRQIWTYYTHMAGPEGDSFIAEEFPPGTFEQFVEAGTLLGYQGNYSGNPANPVGVHLHFSVVRDNGSGQFLNELEINNTLDPSPYFGLPLNANENMGEIPVCKS